MQNQPRIIFRQDAEAEKALPQDLAFAQAVDCPIKPVILHSYQRSPGVPHVPKPGDDNAAGCPSTTSFVLSRSVCMMHGINGAEKWENFAVLALWVSGRNG